MRINFNVPSLNYKPYQTVSVLYQNSPRPYQNSTHTSFTNCISCNYDKVLFTGTKKKTLEEEIAMLGRKNIPKAVLKKAEEALAQNRSDISLFDIHEKHYAPLLDCETLDEVKAIYPEFEALKQVRELSVYNNRPKDSISRIRAGQFPGLTQDNATFMFLKRTYCGVEFGGLENNSFGLGEWAYMRLKDKLGITKLEKNYAAYLLMKWRHNNSEFDETWTKNGKKLAQWQSEHQTPETIARNIENLRKATEVLNNSPELLAKRDATARANLEKLRQDPEYAARQKARASEHMTRLSQDQEFKDKATAARRLKRKTDPEYAAMMAEILSRGTKLVHSDPQIIAKRIANLKLKHKDPQYRAVQDEAHSRMMIAVFDEMPNYVMEIYSDVAKSFPELSDINRKRRNGIKLSEKENRVLNIYYSAVHKACPELGELQSRGMKKHGYLYKVVQKEYDEAKAEGRLDELLAAWKKARRLKKPD